MTIPDEKLPGKTAYPTASTSPNVDLYSCFIQGHEGIRPRAHLIPAGLHGDQIDAISAVVLKPDGSQFAATYPRIAQGTRKGDAESRRACLLRYILRVFPRAQIIGSGGTEASFHIVLPLDPKDYDVPARDRTAFGVLLSNLRVLGFCDQLSHGLLGALSARAVGSVNSKSGAQVVEIQSATGVYALQELEALADAWFKAPEVTLFRAWFGVEDGQVRCPIHDSADPDMKVADKLICFGANHCAADRNAAVINMVQRRKGDKEPSLNALLFADELYRERWSRAYLRSMDEYKGLTAYRDAQRAAEAAGKCLLSIDHDTTDDAILTAIHGALAKLTNIYCDAANRLITLEPDRQDGKLRSVHHDTCERFISVVDRGTVVRTYSSNVGWRYRPLPHDRAVAVFHRPELRDGLRVLARVSTTPVLDLENLRVQPPGYDATTRVFYDGPSVDVPANGLTPMIDHLFSGWTGMCGSQHRSCRAESDVAHLYAALFTEVLADCGLFTLHRHPLLRGNQKGVGKDKIAEILGILRDGETPVDLNHTDENRINQGFGNGIHAGRRIFQATNIDCSGAYGNAMLTRWLTSESLTGPKHGGGTWSINPNTATVVFTINRGSIDHDLLDRLLPANLEVTGDARKRAFTLDPVQFAREHRLKIVGEVLGLALICLREGRQWTIPQGVDRRFERWMRVIGAMLERRGLSGFMQEDADIEDEVNEDAVAFAELARRMYSAKGEDWMRVKEIADLCRTSDPSKPALYQDELRGGAPERSFSRYVLQRWVGESVRLPGSDDLIVVLRRGQDAAAKAARFRLEVVEHTPAGPGSADDGAGMGGEVAGMQGASPHPTEDGGALGAGMAGEPEVSPQASPHAKPLTNKAVNASHGDSGDRSFGGSAEGTSAGSSDPNMTPKIGPSVRQSHVHKDPPSNIPAIPGIPAPGSQLSPAIDDPWDGVIL